jgi:hypothetical protein
MPENERRRAYKSAYKKGQRQSGKLKNVNIEFYSGDMALYEHAKANGPMATYIKKLIKEDMGK